MGLDYTALKVGELVAVARGGGWSTFSEGLYRVVKINKMVVVVQRERDAYERTFSVKLRREKGDGDRYRSAYLESVADQQQREAQYAREREVNAMWKDAERAAVTRNLAALKELVDKLSA